MVEHWISNNFRLIYAALYRRTKPQAMEAERDRDQSRCWQLSDSWTSHTYVFFSFQCSLSSNLSAGPLQTKAKQWKYSLLHTSLKLKFDTLHVHVAHDKKSKRMICTILWHKFNLTGLLMTSVSQTFSAYHTSGPDLIRVDSCICTLVSLGNTFCCYESQKSKHEFLQVKI